MKVNIEETTIKKKNERIKKKNSTIGLWEQYNELIRSIHISNSKKKSSSFKKKILDYLKRSIIIFIGAAFTTAAFYFFIEPNNIFNSGLNGFLQVIAKVLVPEASSFIFFRFIYYGLSLLVNFFLVFFLWKKDDADINTTSTCLVYIFSQLIWSFVFDKVNFLFSDLRSSGYNLNYPSYELPFLIVIALIASLIHGFGKSIIMKVQGTVGGHDLVISHFNAKKRKNIFGISVNKAAKIFNFVIIMIIMLVNGLIIEESKVIKINILKRDWEKEINDNILKKKEDFYSFVSKWIKYKEKMINDEITTEWSLSKKTNTLFSSSTTNFKEDSKEDKKLFFAFDDFLKKKIKVYNYNSTFFYHEDFNLHISNNKEKQKIIEKNIEKIESIRNFKKKKKKLVREWKDWLEKRKSEIEEKERNIIKYALTKVTNNYRLLATAVYIFTSSYAIMLFFPYNNIITVDIRCRNEGFLNECLELLEDFSPVFYYAFEKIEPTKKKQWDVLLVRCRMSKWEYELYLPKMKKLGEVFGG